MFLGSSKLLQAWSTPCVQDSVCVVTGPSGSGKSALLAAVLGELQQTTGERIVDGSCALAPQEPWLLGMSIRQNIVMDRQLDRGRYEQVRTLRLTLAVDIHFLCNLTPQRYVVYTSGVTSSLRSATQRDTTTINSQVLEACELAHDLERMPHGDATLVTDSGDSLSGGQQARVSLARTLYTRADVYLLDEPLAALDARVATSVLRGLLLGPLLDGATVILVSGHPAALAAADFVVHMRGGEVASSVAQSPGPLRGLRGSAPDNAASHDGRSQEADAALTAQHAVQQRRTDAAAASQAARLHEPADSLRSSSGSTPDEASASDTSVPHTGYVSSRAGAAAALTGWHESHELPSDLLCAPDTFGPGLAGAGGWRFGASGTQPLLPHSRGAAAAGVQLFTQDPPAAAQPAAAENGNASRSESVPAASVSAGAGKQAGEAQAAGSEPASPSRVVGLPVSSSAGVSRGASCQVLGAGKATAAFEHGAHDAAGEQLGESAVQQIEARERGHVKGSVYRCEVHCIQCIRGCASRHSALVQILALLCYEPCCVFETTGSDR